MQRFDLIVTATHYRHGPRIADRLTGQVSTYRGPNEAKRVSHSMAKRGLKVATFAFRVDENGNLVRGQRLRETFQA